MELNKAMRMCSKNNSALAERQIITSTGLVFNKVLQFSRKDSQFLRMKNGFSQVLPVAAVLVLLCASAA